ncbi:L-asparaginase [Propionibacterium cyclohexanicum]|uniref:L-asparaginase n=1 Tax=Propionibacterium cyclohexanicum TaxID=64702 RepID=A0A1H9SXG0_9ACTN|nr:asparaginase [Propionibacterium cyclohexanicum]SER89063.1 L-asparaginase [Propionibacterium cyclohexanicum]
MRVHIVYTGGTLGMVEGPHGLAPGADVEGWLHTLLAGTELAGCTFFSARDHLIDSSNATPDDWQAVVDELHARREFADAFVVLQGTDSMAYTSSALSYALTEFPAPVVLTGAQYPLGVIGSDAATNVLGALQAATSGRAPGVSLFFGDRLLSGNRATKVSSWSFRGFDSPAVAPLALTGAPWQWGAARARGSGWPDPLPYRAQDVVVLDLAPGVGTARLAAALRPAPAAVVLRAYGVGNLPSEQPGFTELFTTLIDSGTPVVIASQCLQANVRLGHYEASDALARAGAISAGDMTAEAVYAKVIFLLSQGLGGAELAAQMAVDIAGELSAG